MAYYRKRRTRKRKSGGAKNKSGHKFTFAQKAAYHSGRGYAVAHKRKGIHFKNHETRQAFKEGYQAGLRSIARNPKKYSDLK